MPVFPKPNSEDIILIIDTNVNIIARMIDKIFLLLFILITRGILEIQKTVM